MAIFLHCKEHELAKNAFFPTLIKKTLLLIDCYFLQQASLEKANVDVPAEITMSLCVRFNIKINATMSITNR